MERSVATPCCCVRCLLLSKQDRAKKKQSANSGDGLQFQSDWLTHSDLDLHAPRQKSHQLLSLFKSQIVVFWFIFARGHHSTFYQTTPAAIRTSISVIRSCCLPHTHAHTHTCCPLTPSPLSPPPRPASALCTGRRLCSAWLEATGPASCPSTSSWPCGESKTRMADLDGSVLLEQQTAAGGEGKGSLGVHRT